MSCVLLFLPYFPFILQMSKMMKNVFFLAQTKAARWFCSPKTFSYFARNKNVLHGFRPILEETLSGHRIFRYSCCFPDTRCTLLKKGSTKSACFIFLLGSSSLETITNEKMIRGTPEVRSDKSLTIMTFNIRHSTGPTDQWTNGPMDQWTNGPMDQWTNGLMD